MSKPPPLTDRELDVAFRERATDEDIRALRDALASAWKNPAWPSALLANGWLRR
jgi:hypothetical protein